MKDDDYFPSMKKGRRMSSSAIYPKGQTGKEDIFISHLIQGNEDGPSHLAKGKEDAIISHILKGNEDGRNPYILLKGRMIGISHIL